MYNSPIRKTPDSIVLGTEQTNFTSRFLHDKSMVNSLSSYVELLQHANNGGV